MKENKSNAVIAIACVIAAVLMLAALSYAIGKWSLGGGGYEVVIKFPNATGINPNSEVKYAGAHAGKVKEVRLIPRKDQTIDPGTKLFNCVEVVIQVDSDIEVGDDVTATIKQDGFGIAAKYVLLMPGPDHDSPALADGAVIQGETPFDMSDLIQPAGEALEQAKAMVTQLGPILDRLDTISQKLDTSLPPLMDHADKFLQDGDGVLADLNTSGSKENINELLTSLRISTENLKVVTTNAKALTATLADKPWRVFWGGSTIKPPPESEILKSDSVIPLKPEVEVNGPATTNAPPVKKTPIAQP